MKKFLIIFLSCLTVLLGTFSLIIYNSSYVQSIQCYRKNDEDFACIVTRIKDYYQPGFVEARFDVGYGLFAIACDDKDAGKYHSELISDNVINETLMSLNGIYSAGNDFPVFTYLDVSFDDEGDVCIVIPVKRLKIKNGDGVNSKDVHFYSLVYKDDDYSGDDISNTYREVKIDNNWYLITGTNYSG
ncbi:MAG: hypothetical protein MJ084_04045 [Saccharofermentans sp.]|nr:hypothetical protein [Saccharofermentans sp.]